MQNNNETCYIVVAFDSEGWPSILQYRNKLSWFFYNNSPKPFVKLQTAIRNAQKVYLKYRTKGVKVYEVNKEQNISADMFSLYDKKEVYRIGAYVE